MEIPQWYFGPAGDLRQLPPPEMDIQNAVRRFGGTHVGLSGARTVDTLGVRSNYTFSLSYISMEEYFWLESLFTQAVPGPFHLIDPLRVNLLSREGTKCRTAFSSNQGITSTGSSVARHEPAQDSPVAMMKQGGKWSAVIGETLEFDKRTLIPVLTGESLTFSVYVYVSVAMDLSPGVVKYEDSSSVGTESLSTVSVPATTWTRVEASFTPSGSENQVFFNLSHSSGGDSTSTVRVAAPQVEYDTTASDFSPGGGAVLTEITALTPVSPYYPYQSTDLTLMEV